MRVTNNLSFSIYENSLFAEKDFLGSTMLDRIKPEQMALLTVSSQPVVPIEVRVQAQTSDIAKYQTATKDSLLAAVSRNRMTESYLDDAADLVEEMTALAEEAAADNVNDSERTGLDTELQALLADLDNIYENAQFNGDSVAQGGQFTVVAGLSGETVDVNNADLNPSNLGLSFVSIGTLANAQTAVTDLETAASDLDGQISIINNDAELLQNRLATINADVTVQENAALASSQEAYAQISVENSVAAIQAEMQMAVDIQGTRIQDSVVNTVTQSIVAIGSVVIESRDAAIKKSEEEREQERVRQNENRNENGQTSQEGVDVAEADSERTAIKQREDARGPAEQTSRPRDVMSPSRLGLYRSTKTLSTMIKPGNRLNSQVVIETPSNLTALIVAEKASAASSPGSSERDSTGQSVGSGTP